MTRATVLLNASLLLLLTALPCPAEEAVWPSRVLITNDDGLEDRDRLMTLAAAFAPTAEVWVVAARENRSGTGSTLSLGRDKPAIEVERLLVVEATGESHRIELWAVDGYPADCVLFGLGGLLVDDPPDLVVSGINGGPNLGHDWFGSGTIGAARTAAFAGIPALAVSGLDEELPGAAEAVARWVVRLAASPAVRHLTPGRYLTVGLPQIPPQEIRGVRVAPRAPLDFPFILAPVEESAAEGPQTWALRPVRPPREPSDDRALVAEGYIAITPMSVDEVDHAALITLAAKASELPTWEAGAARETKPAERQGNDR